MRTSRIIQIIEKNKISINKEEIFTTKSFVIACLLSIIFIISLQWNIGLISLLYVVPVLVSLLFNSELYIFLTTAISMCLVILSMLLPNHTNPILSFINYDAIINILSFICVGAIGLISVRQKSKEKELETLNEELEMRVLVRTRRETLKAEQLEEEIKTLQEVRDTNVNDGLNKLDKVINKLKILAEVEND